MKKTKRNLVILFIVSSIGAASPIQAQNVTAPSPTLPSFPMSSQSSLALVASPRSPVYSQAQLDQIVAPIALYPDALIGQVLMASTYPLEIVEATRWLQNSGHAALVGDQLAEAVDPQPWDPSVKSLTAFPQVLKLMDSNIQWTEQLGDAFLAQQGAVMDSVQRLRQQAQASGALSTNPQQVVSYSGPDIVIEPQNPDVVYVPNYNPMLVYGSWPYPGYPPYSFYPADYAWGEGPLLGFGLGVVVVDAFWGWNRWDWGRRRMDIDDRRFSDLNRGRSPSTPGFWEHDPSHRAGVPYRDTATRARFQDAALSERGRDFRGYAATVQAQRPNDTVVSRGQTTGVIPPQASRPAIYYEQSHFTQRPTAPAFESFSRGPEVRAQSARGAVSRSARSSGGQVRGGGNERLR